MYLARRIAGIAAHYAMRGVKHFFECAPNLKAHLRDNAFDNKLIGEVGISYASPVQSQVSPHRGKPSRCPRVCLVHGPSTQTVSGMRY
jgi:hypothetical protein